ncbi:MAG: hypothetical protein PVG19_01025 [Desulfobacterales bacterium]|jgi:CRISPR-associated protein Cas1
MICKLKQTCQIMNPQPPDETLLIPVRMLNEYVYCPRLAYMMWVHGEVARGADTVEGAIRPKRVDYQAGKLLASGDGEPEKIHACSAYMSSEKLGITAKVNLVEGTADSVQPVDYKKGKRLHVPAGAYAPERVKDALLLYVQSAQGYVKKAAGNWLSRKSGKMSPTPG